MYHTILIAFLVGFILYKPSKGQKKNLQFYCLCSEHYFRYERESNMHYMQNVCDTHVLHMVETYGVSNKGSPYVSHMVQIHVFHMFFIWIHINNICFHMVRNIVSQRKHHTLYYLYVID
jgi:hypothetical protein